VLKNVKNFLANQPVGPASMPWAMWIWNRSITASEVKKQLNDLIAKGFGGVAIRPGRDMSPGYMTQEFLDNFGIALEIARKNKIGVRLADDFSLIWDGHLDSSIGFSRKLRAEYLTLEREIAPVANEAETEVMLDPNAEYIAQALKRPAKGAETFDVRQIDLPAGANTFRWKAPGSDWRLLIYKREYIRGPSGRGVPNVLNSKAVQLYMQNTLEVVKCAHSRYVPTTFEGFITEMPALRPGGNAIYWDEDIAVKYKSRYKREFYPMLPALFLDLPGAEKYRAQLHVFIYNLIAEKFAVALETWAKKYRLTQWVLWPEAGIYKPENAVGDGFVTSEQLATLGLQNLDGGVENFALLRCAADINTNHHRRETMTVVGRNRVGSGCTPQDLKREIDLSIIAGPSRIIVDGLYFNVEQRNSYKTPHSPFWYSPEWEYMTLLNGYTAKLKDMLNGLQTSREVAVLTPSECIMGDYMPGMPAPAASGYDRFQKTIAALCGCGKTFDIVTEDLLLTCMIRQNGEFATADRIRKGNYQALVVPYAPLVTRRLLVYLEKLAIKGTTLIFVDEAPIGTFEDGASKNVVERISKVVAPRRENVFVVPAAELETPLARMKPELLLTRESGDEGANIAVQVFHGEGGKLYMMHNMLDSGEQFVIAEMQNEKHFAILDMITGELYDIEPFEVEKNIARLRLAFSPLQTMFMVSSPVKLSTQTPAFNPFTLPPRSYRIIFKDQWDFEPLTPNVLPLSNWKVKMGMSAMSGQISHAYEATFEVKDFTGGCTLAINGLSRTDAPHQAVEISLNGVRIDGAKGVGELTVMNTHNVRHEDNPRLESLPIKIFGDSLTLFEVGEKITKGLNHVSIRTVGSAMDPQTLVFPPFIVGDFSLVKGGYGLAIDKPGIMAGHDSWTKHGYPCMSGRARYTQVFEVPNDYEKLVLRFSNVSGTIYVKVNDADLGMFHWPPMELDVTKYCNIQRNTLTVEVVNTIDNVVRLSGKASGLRGEVYIDVYRD
jgi:hypothetical protein